MTVPGSRWAAAGAAIMRRMASNFRARVISSTLTDEPGLGRMPGQAQGPGWAIGNDLAYLNDLRPDIGREVTDLVAGTTILRRSDAKVVERGSPGGPVRSVRRFGKS